jgi:dihydropteroate synthase
MGIVNVTPDSFSDGGKLRTDTPSSRFTVSIDKALAQAESMLAEGATILDIGGESTRPGARPLSEQEELDRVIPVLEAIQDRLDVDVRALQRPGAVAAVSSGKSAVCLMHMRGEPGTMQQEIHYDDVVEEVLAFLRQRIAVCEAAGILRSRLILDPGFGFGKTVRHNWLLLQSLHCFKSLGLPILAGISRKSMLGAVTGRPVDERVHAGVAAAMLALRGGAAIIRTHDVAPTVDAIKIHCAVEGAR